MNSMLIVLVGILAGSLIIQFGLVLGFVSRLRAWRTPLLEDKSCPPAVVILCLRGGDPFLTRCLQGLLSQDYPNYEIRFMVDHADDPAMAILKSALSETPADRYQIELLSSPLSTCSLKCTCLGQAIDGLPESIEIVALLDADTIPHRSWLRELATALAPSNVGAATGNRWYMPTHVSDGSLVRYVWNAAAIVQMYWYEIAWGGTLALKLDSIRRTRIVEQWRLAYCEDTIVRNALSTIGEKVVFVPSLMMINREDCTLQAFQSWVKRQLLAARLYHPFWLLVVGHGISSAAVVLWLFCSCAFLIFQGRFAMAFATALAFIAFHIALTGMLPWIERAVCDIAKERGEPIDWPERPRFGKLLWIAWKTQWVYTMALLHSSVMNRCVWRGIEYEVAGPLQIKMLGYRPYQDHSHSPDNEPHSI